MNPSWGGPIVRDKLWFYNSFRYWGTDTYLAGLYRNATPLGYSYTPDLNNQADARVVDGSSNLRLTWQATQKNKISAFWDEQPHCTCNYPGFDATASPEATGHGKWSPNSFRQLTWKSPLTSRLLLDTGLSQVMTNWYVHLQTDPLVTADTIPMTAQTGVIRSFRSGPIAQLGQHKSNPDHGESRVELRHRLPRIQGRVHRLLGTSRHHAGNPPGGLVPRHDGDQRDGESDHGIRERQVGRED